MNSFIVKLFIFLTALILDIIFYIQLWSPDFAKVHKNTYLLISMINDPIFIGGIILGFLAFKKSNFKTAFFFIFLPLILTSTYYLIFR